MSFMGGFLTVGILTAFLAGLAAVFLNIPALSLAVSAVFVLLMSGLILYETANIVRGGGCRSTSSWLSDGISRGGLNFVGPAALGVKQLR